jgi:molybdopterin-containing oxidoreductase family iron-sulfur binding subunit
MFGMPQIEASAEHAAQAAEARSQKGWDRRTALRFLGTNIALLAASCGKPYEEIVPYVRMPERLVPGIPLRFATSLELGGFGRGVLVTSQEGRPIKIEGNPLHPASLGATDIFAEAELLNLYDPERAQTVRQNGAIASWGEFLRAWQAQLNEHRNDGGASLRLLTGPITSPTLLKQIADLKKQFPHLHWHAYDPAEDSAARAGTQIAYGKQIESLPNFRDADVIVTLDADPIGAGPHQIAFARSFGERRRPRRGGAAMPRLYAIESVPTLTGANADHRLASHPGGVSTFAIELARRLGGSVPEMELAPERRHFADVLLRDLKAHQGRSLIFAGRSQPPAIHALVHWINAQLKAPISYIETPLKSTEQTGLKPLTESLDKGEVRSLIIMGCNPAYDVAAELNFGTVVEKAQFRAYCGLQANETAALCEWLLPVSHLLESWSDIRALDGTASIVQPLIAPLYDTRTAHQLIAMFGGAFDASSYDLVRETWRLATNGQDFEEWWRRALHDGAIPGTAAAPAQLGAPQIPNLSPSKPAEGITLVLAPDPSLWDGRYATNAWLQECPKPFTKQVWGNALSLNAEDAAAIGARDGDVIRLTRDSRHVDVPLHIQSGQARGVAGLTLGYGRTEAGPIGGGIGANAYILRDEASPWVLDHVGLTWAGGKEHLLKATAVTKLDDQDKDLYPVLTLEQLPGASLAHGYEHKPTLFPAWPRKEPAWAMVIDNTACIGCNACVIACQAENNIPAVGPEEVSWGRIMHWIRIDLYHGGRASGMNEAIAGFNPVPCMHCEKAPCEPVCPVAASVHDDEGLNVQVYNRCIGTRFCQANCPYKVRRFNWFGYADGQEFGNLGAESLKAAKNPNVTVRARGVMEKCTYCVQRISQARRTAEKENRDIREGEVVTACQAACPTRAIMFGDLMRKESEVSKLQAEPQHYALLGHLGTQPRTTYLARVRNPNPELHGGIG